MFVPTRRNVWIIAALSALAHSASAQGAEAEPAAQLDVALLLDVSQVQANQVSDEAWSLSAGAGRKLIALPVRLSPVQEAIDLDRPPFSLRSAGRFLAWQVPPYQPPAEQGRTMRGRRGAQAYGPVPGDAYGDPMLDPYNEYGMGGGMPPARPAGRGRTPVNAAAQQESGVPAGAPRLARQITLTPDGRVRWGLDRAVAALPGIQPNRNSLYALKARPDLLQELEPARPGASNTPTRTTRTPRGADALFDEDIRVGARRTAPAGSDTLTQRRAEQAAYREAVQQFQQLRNEVMGLDENFHQQAPTHVYAIFEVPVEINDLAFAGDDPLPWRIGFGDLQTLADIAQRGGRSSGQLDPQLNSAIFQLTQMAGDNHPLTHRLIASVLVRGNLMAAANRGDALYRLIGMILAGDDFEARRIALEGLAEVTPPTPASVALLHEASATMPAELKLIALRGLLRGNFADPQESAAMVTLIRAAMADPQGPDAGQVLRQVVEQVGDNPEAIALLSGAVDFTQLSEDRLDEAISYVAPSAAVSPLSAAWLDRGLLGAFDPRIARQTLQRIADADTGPSPARWLAAALTRLVFTPPAPEDAPAARLAMTQPIPLTSSRHNLLNLLQSGDVEMRKLAWDSLLAFQVPTGEPTARATRSRRSQPQAATEQAEAGETLDRIVRAALAQPTIPTTLAPFLGRQNHPRATAALVQLLIVADDDTARQAATALLGSGRALGTELVALEPTDRATFARRFYERVTGEAPRVVALPAEPSGQAAMWLGERIAAGQVPPANDWAASLNEQALLQLAAGQDADLAAAAIATLVYAAGGDRFAVDEQIQRFAGMSDRNAGAVAAAWDQARREIFTRRLADAAGTYALVLHVYPPGAGPTASPARQGRRVGGVAMPQAPMYDAYIDDPYGDPYGDPYAGLDPYGGMNQPMTPAPAPVAKPQTHRLAAVELVADGTTVEFRNATVALSVPADAFAIRLNNAGELKNFPVEAVQKLDLQSISQPIDLLPQADGSWKGAGRMRSGETVEVELKPASD